MMTSVNNANYQVLVCISLCSLIQVSVFKKNRQWLNVIIAKIFRAQTLLAIFSTHLILMLLIVL